jgi:signal transduction histidine kinase
MPRRALLVIAVALGGLASAAVEQRAPGYGLVDGVAARVLVFVAGVALVLRPGRPAWLAAAAAAWFLAAWNSPAAGSALLFTAALLVGFAAGPLAVRAMVPGRLAFVPVAAALGVTGLAAAAFTDPLALGCNDCPRNLLLVHADQGVADALQLVGRLIAGAALLAIMVVRRPSLAVAVLCAVSALAPSAGAGRIALAIAFVGLAAEAFWSGVRRRRARTALARLVVDVEGGLAEALGRTLGDPGLRIAYPLADGRVVDATGRAVNVAPRPGEAVTAIVGNDRVLAQLVHRAGTLERPGLADDVATAARLALQHERLAAELRARLGDLQASRGRIVAAADAERSQLERNLHDGAQQLLVALMIDLRVAAAAQPECAVRLDAAAEEVSLALDELRRVAGGLYPPALEDGGLAAALRTLAEDAAVPVELRAVPAQRAGETAEAAAYFVAAGLLRQAGPDGVTITAGIEGGALWLEMRGAAGGDTIEFEDRAGALGGRFSNGDGRYRVELPCVS